MENLSSQPVWIQVFVGLFLFFVGLPLVVATLHIFWCNLSDLFTRTGRAKGLHDPRAAKIEAYSRDERRALLMVCVACAGSVGFGFVTHVLLLDRLGPLAAAVIGAITIVCVFVLTCLGLPRIRQTFKGWINEIW